MEFTFVYTQTYILIHSPNTQNSILENVRALEIEDDAFNNVE